MRDIESPSIAPSAAASSVMRRGTSASTKEVLLGAIAQMVGTVVYDAVIVCTSNVAQE